MSLKVSVIRGNWFCHFCHHQHTATPFWQWLPWMNHRSKQQSIILFDWQSQRTPFVVGVTVRARNSFDKGYPKETRRKVQLQWFHFHLGLKHTQHTTHNTHKSIPYAAFHTPTHTAQHDNVLRTFLTSLTKAHDQPVALHKFGRWLAR
jgi:hypothetical protein